MNDESRDESIEVQVWSDVACPWCYIGKRRLEQAIVSLQQLDAPPEVTVTYRSYQLTPDAPASFDGSELQFQIRFKDRTRQEAMAMMAESVAAAEEVGLHYDFDRLRPTNTQAAHELLAWSATVGRRSDLLDRLYSAHFEQGIDVGDPSVLAELAGEIGLAAAAAAAVLSDGRFRPVVLADQAAASVAGVRGVPYVIIDGRFRIAGAPDVKTYADTFAHIVQSRRS